MDNANTITDMAKVINYKQVLQPQEITIQFRFSVHFPFWFDVFIFTL